MAKLEFLGLTKDGCEVFARVDTDEEHLHCSKVSLRQALQKITLGGKKDISRHEVIFDYNVGKDRCVQVQPDDKVIMWQRAGRKGKTPMVLNRKSDDTKQLNVVIDFDDKQLQQYVVLTAFYGMMTPQEPWDDNVKDKEKSEIFWSTHAIVPDTKTAVAINKSMKAV